MALVTCRLRVTPKEPKWKPTPGEGDGPMERQGRERSPTSSKKRDADLGSMAGIVAVASRYAASFPLD